MMRGTVPVMSGVRRIPDEQALQSAPAAMRLKHYQTWAVDTAPAYMEMKTAAERALSSEGRSGSDSSLKGVSNAQESFPLFSPILGLYISSLTIKQGLIKSSFNYVIIILWKEA